MDWKSLLFRFLPRQAELACPANRDGDFWMSDEFDVRTQIAENLGPYNRVLTSADLDDIRTRIRAAIGGDWTYDSDALKTYCALLFKWGDVRDSLLVWNLKQLDWDWHNSILIEWTCGAGVEATRTFLTESEGSEAKTLLAYIDDCSAKGTSFKEFTPSIWMYRTGYQLPTLASELAYEPYKVQELRWPREGRRILAHYDDDTIIVYQAFRSEIGNHAVRHQKFGDGFSLSRMSWVKPNFLWMMYRSGWATKENQEMVLALRLRRSFFDRILGLAVASSFDASVHPTEDAWRAAGATSDVRLQWDPDHEPMGSPVARRAIQLGLRGKVLGDYASKDIRSADNQLLEVIDMTAFVGEQKAVLATAGISALTMPVERVYRPADAAIAQRIGLD